MPQAGPYAPGTTHRIARAIVRRAAVQRVARSSLGIAAMVGMAVTMEHAGMTRLLADGLVIVTGLALATGVAVYVCGR